MESCDKNEDVRGNTTPTSGTDNDQLTAETINKNRNENDAGVNLSPILGSMVEDLAETYAQQAIQQSKMDIAQMTDEKKNLSNNKHSDNKVEEEDEGIKITEDDADGDKITAKDIPDHEDRNELYDHAVSLEHRGRRDSALDSYLRCLDGLQEDDTFRSLPQCLHRIADSYFAKEEYEKAVQFIQAEKMYYETALIDMSHIQKKLAEARNIGSISNLPEEEKRAEEYERLAKICLEKKQLFLALEYAGKATKLRQAALGSNHPVTMQSLELFTTVYGEVGKQQYSESLEKFKENIAGEANTDDKHTSAAPASDSPDRYVLQCSLVSVVFSLEDE